jgi:flagellar biosynthesis protein FlhF
MNARTYQAATMAEALANVKRDLGRDAVILHTRSLRKGRILGLFGGRNFWEITAAPNMNLPRRVASGKYVSDGGAAAKESIPMPGFSPVPAMAVEPPTASGVDRVLGEIRGMMETLLTRPPASSDLPAALQRVRDLLDEQDVADAVAEGIVARLRGELTGEQMADEVLIEDRLREILVSMLPTASDADAASARGGRKVISLIGPTGVGKTTTIAKLAANYKLREGKRVGLLTIDTYRIAAVDQLRTYAEIIDVPLRTVMTAGELRQAVQSMDDVDVMLIDTAGRSQNDALRLSQLRSFLAAAEADEVHLVVSATANRRTAAGVLEKFLPLGANRILITKLDEAATFGMILNVAAASKAPLSYVTAGQDVPDDISPASSAQVADMILSQEQRRPR